jgi:Uma2 family endonuclease
MAQPTHGAWNLDLVRQRRGDYTIEDVLNFPPEAPRVELVDGVVFVVPSPTVDHQNISGLIWAWLRAHAPSEFKAAWAVGVASAINHTYEPDVLLHRSGGSGQRHFLAVSEVVLVVEVVSPQTRARDRFGKPAEYAASGIPFYWRVEQNPIHIYAYRLAPGDTYELAAESSEVLELDDPFPLKLPISEITP